MGANFKTGVLVAGAMTFLSGIIISEYLSLANHQKPAQLVTPIPELQDPPLVGALAIVADRELDILEPIVAASHRRATQPASAPSSPSHGSYRIRNGDTLSGLAARFTGGARHWRKLYKLNRDRIADPDRLEPGTVIRVPRSRRR